MALFYAFMLGLFLFIAFLAVVAFGTFFVFRRIGENIARARAERRMAEEAQATNAYV